MTKVQIETLRISPPSPRTLTGNLSGGNQQKVALARALSAGVKLLLVEEPTQGIDVNSRAEIHALLTRMATEENCAVVVASSEFEELIGLADVIHVMRLGPLRRSSPVAAHAFRTSSRVAKRQFFRRVLRPKY